VVRTVSESNEIAKMSPEQMDLTVFARDFPETRLVLEVKSAISAPLEKDPTIKRIASRMWGANCHFGLILTPSFTYLLRDDFSTSGPEAIRVTDILATAKLLGRLSRSSTDSMSSRELEPLAREWLQRLTTSYESALPDDPDVVRALFPDLIGAVADGRVVAEVAA